MLKENAIFLIYKLIPENQTEADRQEGVKIITEMMSKSGVTSVTDAYGLQTDLKAYRDAYSAGELKSRIYCMISYMEIDDMISKGAKTGDGDQWVKLGGMKLTCDGSISERTARLSEPYIGKPNDYGIIAMEKINCYEDAMKAYKANWQIGIHANGDVEIYKSLMSLKGFKKNSQGKIPNSV